jgi:hypothetical protein
MRLSRTRQEDCVYRTLRADRIIEAASRLEVRIVECFPESRLGRVAAELSTVANDARGRCQTIRKSHLPARIGGFLLVALGFGGLAALFSRVEVTDGMWRIDNFLEGFDAALGSAVFLGARWADLRPI